MWAGIAQELFQSTPAIADGRTAQGIKCLDNYQYEWDDKLGRWKNRPLHNWASHGCDAWRQHAQTLDAGESTEPAINAFANRTRESWR